MKDPRVIVITGASSGIGEALALKYSAAGRTLHLLGRNQARLDRVAALCRQSGATVVTALADIRDRAAMAALLLDIDQQSPIDLIIANAGISAGTGEEGETDEQARAIFAVNVDGVLNTIHPVLPKMIQRRRGQLAIMSSLASFRGFPGAPAYCASKAAVRVYGEALRGHLKSYGVGVSIICPGFIKTPMTAGNRFPMPFLMSAERAASIIQKKLAGDKPLIAFPWSMYMIVRLLAFLPARWVDFILGFAPHKISTSAN